MASLKIVQNIGEINYSGVSSISPPISLKSGFLRIANGPQFAHVAIGTDIVATPIDFGICVNETEIIKERVSSCVISGITTGTTTTLIAPSGTGQPFVVGDYVSITGFSGGATGINTNWARVTSVRTGLVWETSSGNVPGSNIVVQHNTSSILGPIDVTGTEVRRAVKVAIISEHGTSFAHLSEVQIAGN
jgi:hypothetical protein